MEFRILLQWFWPPSEIQEMLCRWWGPPDRGSAKETSCKLYRYSPNFLQMSLSFHKCHLCYVFRELCHALLISSLNIGYSLPHIWQHVGIVLQVGRIPRQNTRAEQREMASSPVMCLVCARRWGKVSVQPSAAALDSTGDSIKTSAVSNKRTWSSRWLSEPS